MNSLVQRVISLYKKKKKEQFLSGPSGFKKQYAFIGTGSHAIQNLYPCLGFMGVPLRTVVSRDGISAKQMASRFDHCKSSDNINSIITDPAIAGVFVCTDPGQHFEITKALLAANKHVFVEKPPCQTRQELEELVALQKNLVAVTGLQKRCSDINQVLTKKIKLPCTYSCRYLFGAYTEGDPVTDLFIHPIDNLVQLFGDAVPANISKVTTGQGVTFFVTLHHSNSVKGILEISTAYTWSAAVDHLEINTPGEIFKAEYPGQLKSLVKPRHILNVPFDKVFKNAAVEKIYLNNNSAVPSMEYNPLSTAGFYNELKAFTGAVEKDANDLPGFSSLLNTYTILEALKAAR
jgi:virulence factor